MIKMKASVFSVNIETSIDKTLLKLREALGKKWFEIIAESEVSDRLNGESINQNVCFLCKCNSKTSAGLLKNEKAVYVPSINLLVHELDQNNTEITVIDPVISMTPIQAVRMGQVAAKLGEMLKNVIRNL